MENPLSGMFVLLSCLCHHARAHFSRLRVRVRVHVCVRVPCLGLSRDGVDRSNGFEAQMFKMKNDISTRDRDMRQWVTSMYE